MDFTQNTEKLVSIITPTYNCGPFIARTIESIQQQTYKNWEMIIVDDCSTDNTKQIVEQYMQNDPRIQYHCLDKNSGAAVARTTSMQLAKGSYMAFCDSDDVWTENKLQRQISWMQQNGYHFSCTSYDQIDEADQSLNKIIKPPKKISYDRQLLDAPIGNSTVIYDVEAMGKFEVPNIKKRNDDALWFQLYKVEKYCYGLNEILAHYRIRKGSISSNKVQLLKYHWILYRDICHLSVIRSVFHIAVWGVIKVLHIK